MSVKMTAAQKRTLLDEAWNMLAAVLNSIHRQGPHAWDNTIAACGRLSEILHEIEPDKE